MDQTNEPKLPGGEAAADEMERALKKAASVKRDDPDAHDIAADDAGASALAETPAPQKP